MLRPRTTPSREQIAATHPDLIAEKEALYAEITTTTEAVDDWNRRAADFRRRWVAAGLPSGLSLTPRTVHDGMVWDGAPLCRLDQEAVS